MSVITISYTWPCSDKTNARIADDIVLLMRSGVDNHLNELDFFVARIGIGLYEIKALSDCTQKEKGRVRKVYSVPRRQLMALAWPMTAVKPFIRFRSMRTLGEV